MPIEPLGNALGTIQQNPAVLFPLAEGEFVFLSAASMCIRTTAPSPRAGTRSPRAMPCLRHRTIGKGRLHVRPLGGSVYFVRISFSDAVTRSL